MSAAARVIAGHVTHDRVDGALQPGGSGWYGARAWRRLGRAPTLITAVGDDFAHDAALAGLGARVARRGRTTLFANTYPADGPRIMRCEAQAPAVRPPAGLAAELLVLAPVLGEIELAAWAAVPARLRVLGLQGWLKKRSVDDRVMCHPASTDPRAFAGADAVSLSDEDLGGDHAWLARLTAAVPVVALTQGARGSTLFLQGQPHVVPAQPVCAPAPTGAGDTWLAVFSDALALGHTPLQAAAVAGHETAAFLRA